jgi:hypothetical protein
MADDPLPFSLPAASPIPSPFDQMPEPQLTPRQVRAARLGGIHAGRLSGLEKAWKAKLLKKQKKAIVMEKLAAGIPISPEEQELVTWSAANSKKRREEQIIDAAAKLVIRPQNVNELRLVVQNTAARHAYNPIEKLILLSNDDEVEKKDQIMIHKALLPFLAPQIPSQKDNTQVEDEDRVKVTVTQFVFPAREKPDIPIHAHPPPMITEQEPAPLPEVPPIQPVQTFP